VREFIAWLWSVIAGVVPVLALMMAFARTGPDDAVSNLSKWAGKFGLKRLPEWLLSKDADRWTIRWTRRTILILSILGVTLFAYWMTLKERYEGDVRTALVYTGGGRLSTFVTTYNSAHGFTVSPICFLLYLTLTNNDKVIRRITDYKVEISSGFFKSWKPLAPIPLEGYGFYQLGITSPRIGGGLIFRKGTYNLGTTVQEDALHAAAPENADPLFDNTSNNDIEPNHTTEGWAAFDCNNISGSAALNYRLTFIDADGHEEKIRIKTPTNPNGDARPGIGRLRITGASDDLGHAYVKYRSEQ
jgi:hypothetical protein